LHEETLCVYTASVSRGNRRPHMACTETARIELHEKLLNAIGNQVLKQKMEIDLMHSTIHELGNTVITKYRDDHQEYLTGTSYNHKTLESFQR
jgi:hypothetical protein